MTSYAVRGWKVSLVAGCLMHALAGASPAQLIPDKNLEAALRAMVFEKKSNTEALTEDDLKKIYIVDASGQGRGIQNLSGIEKCINLLQLNLSKNEIRDIAPLKELKNVQSLDLSKNKIVDVAALAELTALQYLELSDNQIVSVEPLAKLEKLSALYIAGNKIADAAPLAALTRLASLDLARNNLGDIKGLTNVGGLSLLKLSDNHISDLSPLNRPLSLGMLLLERNKISDLAPLIAAAKADLEGPKRFAPFLRLYLTGNPVCGDSQKQQIEALRAAGVKVFVAEPEKPERSEKK